MTNRKTESDPPPGVTLKCNLQHDNEPIRQMAWSLDGVKLASATSEAILVWDSITGKVLGEPQKHSHLKYVAWSHDWQNFALSSYSGNVQVFSEANSLLQTLEGHTFGVTSLAYSPDGEHLASGTGEGSIRIWIAKKSPVSSSWALRHNFYSHSTVTSLAWTPSGAHLAVGHTDGSIRVWDINSGEMIQVIRDHSDWVTTLAWSPDGKTLVSGSKDELVRYLREDQRGILEAHTGPINAVSFSFDGNFLATKSFDETIRIWRCKNWETVAIIHEPASDYMSSPLVFHPKRPILATLGQDSKVIRIWDLDFKLLLNAPAVAPTVFYTNAKVVLVGDSGVGKSGLGLVLSNQRFVPTDSTHGRHIWTFDTEEIKLKGDQYETRETLLWDLAGQPSYRLIHQLHLNEVAVALVVFDARSDTDPFAGVRYWSRAINQAESLLGGSSPRIKKILVEARIDRGGVNVSQSRLKKLAKDHGFNSFYSTSAKEGLGIDHLARAIKQSIDWISLPRVSSTELFQKITSFLMEEKSAGRVLSTVDDLYRTFLRYKDAPKEDETLPAQFKTCIRLMGSRGLIRRLSFGNFVLLQPELLDAYASAMVNAAKDEPDGLGSISEEDGRAGRFNIPESERVKDIEQEKLLLIATVEDLLSHEIALREHADDGTHLVFPSQLTRRNPSLPDPEGKAVVFSFAGPVRNIYATLAVRLSHSGLFKKKEMWRNAAAYEATVGGTCGMFVNEIDEGYGELTLFFNEEANEQTRFQFEEYVNTHLSRKAIYDSLERHRIFTCNECGFVVPKQLIRIRAQRRLNWINCPGCQDDKVINLVDSERRLVPSARRFVPEMDRAADVQREFDTGLVSAVGQMRSQSFKDWAGALQTTAALIFTDVVGSTAITYRLGNESMEDVRRSHFEQARRFTEKFEGYEIKTIGDSFMVAFRTAMQALDFALALYSETGNRHVRIRAGLHVGALHIEEEDAFGIMVNYTSRIAHEAEGAEIWISDAAKSHVDEEKAKRHSNLEWVKHPDCELKGFEGKHILWSLPPWSI